MTLQSIGLNFLTVARSIDSFYQTRLQVGSVWRPVLRLGLVTRWHCSDDGRRQTTSFRYVRKPGIARFGVGLRKCRNGRTVGRYCPSSFQRNLIVHNDSAYRPQFVVTDLFVSRAQSERENAGGIHHRTRSKNRTAPTASTNKFCRDWKEGYCTRNPEDRTRWWRETETRDTTNVCYAWPSPWRFLSSLFFFSVRGVP